MKENLYCLTLAIPRSKPSYWCQSARRKIFPYHFLEGLRSMATVRAARAPIMMIFPRMDYPIYRLIRGVDKPALEDKSLIAS